MNKDYLLIILMFNCFLIFSLFFVGITAQVNAQCIPPSISNMAGTWTDWSRHYFMRITQDGNQIVEVGKAYDGIGTYNYQVNGILIGNNAAGYSITGTFIYYPSNHTPALHYAFTQHIDGYSITPTSKYYIKAIINPQPKVKADFHIPPDTTWFKYCIDS
jgi:hypothetical protein